MPADQVPTHGVFLPSKLIKRLAEGRGLVLLNPDPSMYQPDTTYLVVDAASVVGTVTPGESRAAPAEEAFKLDHGYKAQGMAKRWPDAEEVTVWPVEFSPLVERVPLAVQASMEYGEVFKVSLDAPVVPLTAEAVEAIREAKRGARSWVQGVGAFMGEVGGHVGPATGALLAVMPRASQGLQDALKSIAVQGGTRAPVSDFTALVDHLGPTVRKLAQHLPPGPLQDDMEARADYLEALAPAVRYAKAALPALKLPDPLWVVKRLTADKEAGFLSGRPRSARQGRDQYLVNEKGMKEGTPEVYAQPYAWAIVRTGEPRQVDHADLASLPLDSFTRAEWKDRTGDTPWYIPIQLVRALDPPVELREAPPGRRFASGLDLEAAAVTKADLPDPTDLRTMDQRPLLVVHDELVADWEERYQGNSKVPGREDLINAILFTRQEIERRGTDLPELPGALDAELGALEGAKQKQARATAEIKAGSGNTLPPITLAQVLDGMRKPIVLRRGVVTVTGSVCNQGATRNDVDVLIQGPMDDGLRKVVEFRLGRSFPATISQRLSFLHDPELGGPFTDHVEAFDLVLVPRDRHDLIEMRAVEKAGDPLLDMPPKRGPRQAVFQYHWRGKTLHGDLRFKVGSDFLVGWTLLLQKPGVPEADTVANARDLARTFNADGGRYNKDMVAPEGIQATPKKRQPVEWLHVTGEHIEPGEVGATTNLPGIIVEVPGGPEFVELGVQKAWFHEYFLTGGDKLIGRLMFRQLPQSSQSDQPFWRAIMSKEFLPSVLDRRAVNTKSMPPDGYSWIPVSLERVTPKEFRYWEHKGEEARKIRDALVDARFFTKDNVKIVNGQFARVDSTRKYHLYIPDGMEARDVVKQPERAPWVMVHQVWKGQQVTRTGPSREVWRFGLERKGHPVQFELQSDPDETGTVSAIMKPLKGNALWDLEGEIEPGKAYGGDVFNNTKATPSVITRLDKGTATILEDGPGRVQLRLRGDKLRGVFTLEQEEEGSDQWMWSRVEGSTPQVDKEDPVEEPKVEERQIAAKAIEGAEGSMDMAVGPVPDPVMWSNVVEVGGESYVAIGAVGADAGVSAGDVIAVNVLDVTYKRDAEGKQHLRCGGSIVKAGADQLVPFTPAQVLDLLRPAEFNKYVDTVIGNLLKIVKADQDGQGASDRCFVFGEVLVPNIGTTEGEDSQGDTYTVQDVEEACYSFMRHGHRHGLMHSQFIDGKITLLENYLMPMDVTLKDQGGQDRTIPKGTWMMKCEVLDPELKAAVRAGQLTGFSVGGSGIRTRVG